MKPTIKKILYFIAFAIMIGAFIYLGAKDFSLNDKEAEAKNFATEYKDVPAANVFDYLTTSEMHDFFKSGTGIIFLGNPNSPWSQTYAKYLYEITLEYDLNKIAYYDLGKDKKQQNTNYQNLLKIVKDQVYTTDEAAIEIFTPCLFVIKDGQIIGYNDTTALINAKLKPEDFWQLNEVIKFKEEIGSYLLMIGE